uniref:Uncharacterized protein n=1 Tax=Oryza glaberrima TaxID=4538 RepID=I1PFW9_ORYGL
MFFIEFRQRVQARGDSRYGRRVGREGASGRGMHLRDDTVGREEPHRPGMSAGQGRCRRTKTTSGGSRAFPTVDGGCAVEPLRLGAWKGAIFSIPAGDALTRAACRDVCQNMHTPVHDESMKPMEIASETAACNAHRRRFYVCIVCPGLASCGEFERADEEPGSNLPIGKDKSIV